MEQGMMYIAIGALLFLMSCSQDSPANVSVVRGETSVRVLTVDGKQRYYEVFIPEGLNVTAPSAVILSFHGGGADPRGWATLSKFNERGGALGFVIAYPAGYKRLWHAGDGCCGAPFEEDIDDVAFVHAVLDDIATFINVDPRRVFAVGFSNGGKMTYRLACELSERIAAIAVGGSSLGVSNCRPSRPVPLLAFHGTADTFHPYAGGSGTATSFRMVQTGAPQTVQLWARMNGCAGEPEVTYQKGAATCVTYKACSQNATVMFCTIEGMGHQWPGHTLTLSARRARLLGLPEAFSRLGPGTDDLDATDMVLAFFLDHPMPV